ncbi:TPA: hypothetical protein RQJ57_004231 [Vibrio vulnificus]|nr:hypothetical protein [Vibrio vulnificus]HDY7511967.1 hypothetical protein [Vibrio vulnificus]
MIDFNEQLETQVSFLRRSVNTYDEGHKDEALRLAVTLRVLFHDTKQSVSLLRHLKIKGSLNLISTFTSQNDIDLPKHINWHTVLPLMVSGHNVSAPCEEWKVRSNLPFEKWWNEKIWIEGQHTLSRRDIVLSAANQDGGAHVANKLDSKTKKMKEGPTVTIKVNGKVISNLMDNHHYPLIRQIAHEVLNSPEFISLLKAT